MNRVVNISKISPVVGIIYQDGGFDYDVEVLPEREIVLNFHNGEPESGYVCKHGHYAPNIYDKKEYCSFCQEEED